MSDQTKMTHNALTPVAQKFILHWGEMGTRWGINRTVAQVHALLFLSPRPVPADEISATLAVARSNVSTSLRELQGWRIVRVVHVLGDRRDHFESIKDVWEIFRIVSEERKRREIDPTLHVLADCVQEVKADPRGDAYTRANGKHAGVSDGDDGFVRGDYPDADRSAEGRGETAWESDYAAGDGEEKGDRIKRALKQRSNEVTKEMES